MVEISLVIFFVFFLCMITCFLGGFAFFSLLEYLIDYFRCYVKYTSEQKLKLKEVMYYKDIPCGNDIFKNFCIALEDGIIENKETDFICAIFLKWIKEKKVSVGKIKKGILVIMNYLEIEQKFLYHYIPYEELNFRYKAVVTRKYTCIVFNK